MIKLQEIPETGKGWKIFGRGRKTIFRPRIHFHTTSDEWVEWNGRQECWHWHTYGSKPHDGFSFYLNKEEAEEVLLNLVRRRKMYDAYHLKHIQYECAIGKYHEKYGMWSGNEIAICRKFRIYPCNYEDVSFACTKCKHRMCDTVFYNWGSDHCPGCKCRNRRDKEIRR